MIKAPLEMMVSIIFFLAPYYINFVKCTQRVILYLPSIFLLDVSVSDMNDEDNGNGERCGSSKSNSITSGGSVGISASSQVCVMSSYSSRNQSVLYILKIQCYEVLIIPLVSAGIFH